MALVYTVLSLLGVWATCMALALLCCFAMPTTMFAPFAVMWAVPVGTAWGLLGGLWFARIMRTLSGANGEHGGQ